MTDSMTDNAQSHRRSRLDERCARHQFEGAVDRCRQCGNAFCGECLVYAFGDRQPPFCIPCALSASGVRSGAARVPTVSKRELRKREKEALKAARAPDPPSESDGPEIDWSLPGDDGTSAADPAFPTFEDESRPTRPQAPPPPDPNDKNRSRGSLFGRRNKVVPF